VSVVSEQVTRPVATSRRLSPSILWLVTSVAMPAGIVGWFESVRLRMSTPSLIDDWFGIAYSKSAIYALVHGDYASAHLDFSGRYRPAYTAIWNYAQWHLFGRPSIPVAAAWGALRVASFLVAIWLLALLIANRSNLWQPILWLPPLAVALTPGLAVDLVRYGPADPNMVAGLVIGLTLIGVSVRRLLLAPEPSRRRRMFALLIGGYFVYLMGVYSKEASVCLLAFAPFFAKWLPPPWRATIAASRTLRWLVGLLTLSLVAPLIHVAVNLALAMSAGSDPYAGVHFSLSRKLLAAGVFPLIGAPGPLETLLWFAVVPVALFTVVDLFRHHHPDRWLVLGILSTGFVMSAFSLSRGDVPSRYYIPWILVVAAAALRVLGTASPRLQVAVALLVVGVTLSGAQNAVGNWARMEQQGSTALKLATSAVNAGCPTYLANFDVERRVAVARLLWTGGSQPVPSCSKSATTAYVVNWQSAQLPRDFASRCRSGWQELFVRDHVSLWSCPSLRAAPTPGQDEASWQTRTSVVRLLPPQRDRSPQDLFQRGGFQGNRN
jgi:hypothetical protein